MTEIFTASTLEEAKQKAAAAFGVPLSEIRFTVIEEPKRGLLGGLFAKKPAEVRVEAVYEPAAEPVFDAEPEVLPAVDETPEEPAADIPADAAKADDAEEAAPADDAEGSTDYDPAVALEKMQIALDYLEKLLAQFAPGFTAEGKLGNGIEITLNGEGAGALIGRRGETLDSLQYLTSMVANRGDKEYIRVTLDACGYRSKRRKALQELAERIARNVQRSGKSTALEPMNPYERRIIHSTVTEIEGVTSYSTGEEPYRRVIIALEGAPKTDKPARTARPPRDRSDHSRGGRPDRRGGKGGSGRRERRPSGSGPRKLDLSTSFEKDYKKPKPEDAINAGVYGKIDL